jgi:hypothetical protein
VNEENNRLKLTLIRPRSCWHRVLQQGRKHPKRSVAHLDHHHFGAKPAPAGNIQCSAIGDGAEPST